MGNLRRLISSVGTGGAVANAAACLEDRRIALALVDETCRRLAVLDEPPARVA